jgi:predicted glycosyltransferase
MPEADRARVHARTAARDDIVVRRFVTGLERQIAAAAAVVTMGGYNTVCEVLAAGVPALVVPRVRPRIEQLIRARRLTARGVLDCLHPDELSPGALAQWLAGAVGRGRQRLDEALDLDGLTRIQLLADELLAAEEVVHVAA